MIPLLVLMIVDELRGKIEHGRWLYGSKAEVKARPGVIQSHQEMLKICRPIEAPQRPFRALASFDRCSATDGNNSRNPQVDRSVQEGAVILYCGSRESHS